MARKDYDPLRQAHQQALETLNNLIERSQAPQRAEEPDRGPERPVGHPSQSKSPGWNAAGASMPEQNAAANKFNKVAQEHQAALHTLHQRIERSNAGQVQAPENTPDLSPKRDDDIKR
ncbi:hypothetical protein [Nitrospirillum amazonense]|nr:hypothetical protein [Nitrospirillum amazonense]